MTKSEYMDALREKMQHYNKALEMEILEDYEQHFAEGLAQGRTEEEIVAELGNIDEMLQEFSEEDMKQELAAIESQASQSNSYEQIYREIRIEGLLADVEIRRSPDDQIRVDYENLGSKAQKLWYQFYQYEKDGVFYAGVEERKGVHVVTVNGLNSIWDVFSHFNRSGGDIKLRVQIPDGIPAVCVQTTSGDLDICGVQTRELETKCVSGDLKVEDTVSQKLTGGTQSGDVEISGVTMSLQEDTEIKLSTVSGDMEARRLSAMRINLQSASGDVQVRDLESELLRVQTASGEQELDNVTCGSGSLYSGSGDISAQNIRGTELDARAGSGDVELRADARTFDVKTGSGDSRLTVDAQARQIRLTAGSGSVYLDLSRVEGASISTHTGSGDRNIRGQRSAGVSYGSGTCQVRILTGSGDIEVR